MKKVDLDTWERKALFDNFIQFDDPFFNITGAIDVTPLKQHCSEHRKSFFLHSYFFALKALNEIPEYRYRIRGKEVVLHDVVRGSCPILKADRTFGFGYFDFEDDLDQFIQSGKETIEQVKSGAPFDPRFDEDDLIHSSVIPWVSFSSIEHAKRLNKGDSVPKLVLGKTYSAEGRVLMPVSISGHHALVDGLHAGEFFQRYEKLCLAFDGTP